MEIMVIALHEPNQEHGLVVVDMVVCIPLVLVLQVLVELVVVDMINQAIHGKEIQVSMEWLTPEEVGQLQVEMVDLVSWSLGTRQMEDQLVLNTIILLLC